MNYARRQPPTTKPGTVFKKMNFSQLSPGTVLVNLAGVPLAFRRCNLVNVSIDKAWTVENCNTAQVAIPPEPTERDLKLLELEDRRRDKTEVETEIVRLEKELDIEPVSAEP